VALVDTVGMDNAVRTELETLLGQLRACKQVSEGVAGGAASGPAVPAPADYIRAMTWARVSGALHVLENLGLVSHDERGAWEAEGRAVLPPPQVRP